MKSWNQSLRIHEFYEQKQQQEQYNKITQFINLDDEINRQRMIDKIIDNLFQHSDNYSDCDFSEDEQQDQIKSSFIKSKEQICDGFMSFSFRLAFLQKLHFKINNLQIKLLNVVNNFFSNSNLIFYEDKEAFFVKFNFMINASEEQNVVEETLKSFFMQKFTQILNIQPILQEILENQNLKYIEELYATNLPQEIINSAIDLFDL